MNGDSEAGSVRIGRQLWLAGGLIALLAAAALVAAVESRSWRLAPRSIVMSLFRAHDVLLLLQSLLLVPYGLALSRAFAGPSSQTLLAAIAGLSLFTMAALHVLYFADVAPDSLYMLPQAVLGLWVIVIGRRMRGRVSPAAARLAIVAGIGLLLVGLSLAMVLAYFGMGLFSGAARDAGPVGQSINQIAHYTLRVGTYAGRLIFPLWVLRVARDLAPGSRFDVAARRATAVQLTSKG